MKTNILLILVVLFASNSFAQTDTLSAKNEVDMPSQQTGSIKESSYKLQDDSDNNASLLEMLKIQIEEIDVENLSLKEDLAKLDNGIASLDDKFLNLQDVNANLAVIFKDIKGQIAGIESELKKTIKVNSDFKLHLSSLEKKYNPLSLNLISHKKDYYNNITKLHEKIIVNGENNNKLNSDIELLQEESFKLREYSDSLKKSLRGLEVNYQQLSTNFTTYRHDTDKVLNSTLQKINHNSAYIKKTADDLEARIAGNIKINNNNIAELSQTVGQQKNYFIAAFIAVILFILIIFFLLRKQMVKQQDDLMINLQDLRQSLEEEGVGHDQKLIEIIETQLKIQGSGNVAAEKEPDHSLALKVADEIIRIQKNLSLMDKKTKGLKQLVASVKRIQDNFASNGYELVEMLGQPYKEGMKIQANFIPDDELEDGQEIITRIIKPQVNYQGTMIQIAQIEVSQG